MIRLALLLLALMPASLLAENVSVKSGDHAGFSRLLLDYDGALDWTFGKVDGGYEFRPMGSNLSWDVSGVFDKISRTRIRDLEDLGDGRLRLDVGCDCHADAFVLRDGQVVIDIKDGPPERADSPFENLLPPAGEAGVGSPEMHGDPEREGTRVTLPSARPSPQNARAGLPLMLPARPARQDTLFAAPDPAPPSSDVSEAPAISPEPPVLASLPEPRAANRVARTEAALLEQLARAAAQGMIEADIRQIEDDVRAATEPPVASGNDQHEPAPAILPPAEVAPGSHVSIETAVDRAAPHAPSTSSLDSEGKRCLAPDIFNIAAWGNPDAAGSQIGAYRSRTLGEFDRADTSAVANLARHYIYLTFGAEAKALMRTYPDVVPHQDLLSIMADVVDFGHATSGPDLAAQMDCAGETALWAVLAQSQLRRGQRINAEAVSLSFAGLPAHLRRHLGPGLVKKFLAMGDLGTADRIQNAMARGAGEHDPAGSVAEARVDLALGNTADAADKLDQVIARESDVLPEAVVTRVQAALDAGQSVPENQISLLQSLAFERKGTAQANDLVALEIRARAASGDVATAFARLEDAHEIPGFTPGQLDALRGEVFSALARDSADPTFLTLAVPRLETGVTLPADLRRTMAERFIDLGLASPARQLVTSSGAIPDKADRVLLARISLLERRPELAVSYLAGLDDEVANRLRADALEATGDFTGAVSLFDELGDLDRGARAAWRGGLWPDLAARQSGAMTVAAEFMVTRSRPTMEGSAADSADVRLGDVDSPPPLAASQSLIDASRETRDMLETLFKAFPQLSASVVD